MTAAVGFYEPPPSDRELTVEQVRDAVREQFPDLMVAAVERLGQGWEHEVYLVDSHAAFRFPRYADVGRGFTLEQRRLELVSSVTDGVVRIPRITWWGKPGPSFPHPFAGHELIPGVQASDPGAPMNPTLADDLGRALRRIHAIAEADAAAAGVDTTTVHRTDLPAALAQTRSWVEEVPEFGECAPVSCAWLQGDLRPPRNFDGPPRFLHDDLQMEHVIVDRVTGRLSGIIDWGGQFGDPARDFSYLLLHGGWSFLQRAVDVYDLPLDTDFLERTFFSARLGAIAWLADAIKRDGDVSRELAIIRRVFDDEQGVGMGRQRPS
jgi:aminoglycoside phosphotransferase (APT) family kinase protein